MLYLATPYSHPDPEKQRERYRVACRATAVLMKAGVPVFSPLLNSVPAVEEGGLELEHSGFMAVDLPIRHERRPLCNGDAARKRQDGSVPNRRRLGRIVRSDAVRLPHRRRR